MQWLLRQLTNLLLHAELDTLTEENGSDVLIDLEVRINFIYSKLANFNRSFSYWLTGMAGSNCTKYIKWPIL